MIYLLSTKNIEFSKKDIRKQNYIHCLKKKKNFPLEKEMATHSSILAWKIPRTEEPGGLQSMR